MKMTLEEACEHWGLKQSEVDFVVSDFEKKSWWRNRRTYEYIETKDEAPKRNLKQRRRDGK